MALALLLAACGSREERAPFTDSRPPPALSPDDWPPHGWAWGLIKIGWGAPQRYGVGAPRTVPRAQILILPGYGDFAESHYAQARALIDRGYVVWILDGAGQGGSGRWPGPRDLGHLGSFDGDERALKAMAAQVIRPSADAPLVIIADGAAAPLALHALQTGQVGVAGLILWAPTLKAPYAGQLQNAVWAHRLGVGFIRVPGGQGWVRDDPSNDPGDQRRHAWQAANPDLRMGAPSLGWIASFDALTKQAAGDGLARVRAPVLLRTADAAPSAGEMTLCHALPRCTLQAALQTADNDAATAAFIQSVMPANALAPPVAPPPSPDDQQQPLG